MGPNATTNWDRDPALALELLAWQVEMGVTDTLDEAPLDRFALSAAELLPAASRPAALPPPVAGRPIAGPPVAAPPIAAPPIAGPPIAGPPIAGPPIAEPQDTAPLAAAAPDLPSLAEVMAGFDGCDLKRGSRSFVFADGQPAARVMVIGEGPGREEDMRGLPFVGAAGQLLDRMFAAIGMRRDHPDPALALYITNTVPWRPEGNRTPTDAEIALLRPFLLRHIELADPAVLVLMGNAACQAVLETKGISRQRGQWAQALGRAALPMYHPSALLHRPELKRDTWADLLSLQARLRELP